MRTATPHPPAHEHADATRPRDAGRPRPGRASGRAPWTAVLALVAWTVLLPLATYGRPPARLIAAATRSSPAPGADGSGIGHSGWRVREWSDLAPGHRAHARSRTVTRPRWDHGPSGDDAPSAAPAGWGRDRGAGAARAVAHADPVPPPQRRGPSPYDATAPPTRVQLNAALTGHERPAHPLDRSTIAPPGHT
jgi:hypothetical protein